MLAMRPNCERCDADLPADAPDAYICSFECTLCTRCANDELARVCPNCGGELRLRPRRPKPLCERYPPSTERVLKMPDKNA